MVVNVVAVVDFVVVVELDILLVVDAVDLVDAQRIEFFRPFRLDRASNSLPEMMLVTALVSIQALVPPHQGISQESCLAHVQVLLVMVVLVQGVMVAVLRDRIP